MGLAVEPVLSTGAAVVHQTEVDWARLGCPHEPLRKDLRPSAAEEAAGGSWAVVGLYSYRAS